MRNLCPVERRVATRPGLLAIPVRGVVSYSADAPASTGSTGGVRMTASDDLTQVYRAPTGPRGERRVSLTENQRVALWSLYEGQVYNTGPSTNYRRLRASARRRAVRGLHAKGLLDDQHYVTDRGCSYAQRLRRT